MLVVCRWKPIKNPKQVHFFFVGSRCDWKKKEFLPKKLKRAFLGALSLSLSLLEAPNTRGCAHKRFSLAKKRMSLSSRHSFTLPTGSSLCLCVRLLRGTFRRHFCRGAFFCLGSIERETRPWSKKREEEMRFDAKKDFYRCRCHSPSPRAFLMISLTDISTSLHKTAENKRKKHYST